MFRMQNTLNACKLLLKCTKLAPKCVPNAFWELQNGPCWRHRGSTKQTVAPRWPQDGSKRGLGGPKGCPWAPKGPLGAPREAQEGPEGTQESPKRDPRGSQEDRNSGTHGKNRCWGLLLGSLYMMLRHLGRLFVLLWMFLRVPLGLSTGFLSIVDLFWRPAMGFCDPGLLWACYRYVFELRLGLRAVNRRYAC